MNIPTTLLAAAVLLAAGCLSEAPVGPAAPGASTDPASGTGLPRAPGALRERALLWDGHLNASACAPTGACAIDAPDNATSPLDGAPLALLANLTWNATSPTTSTLRFLVVATCDGCEARTLAEIEGASPLAIDLSEFDLADGETATLVVAAPPTAAGPLEISARQEQPFRVEGVLFGLG